MHPPGAPPLPPTGVGVAMRVEVPMTPRRRNRREQHREQSEQRHEQRLRGFTAVVLPCAAGLRP